VLIFRRASLSPGVYHHPIQTEKTMKYFVTILFCTFLFITGPSAHAEMAKTQTVFDTVLSKGVLRCGYAAWEPMFIIDPNTKKLSGISYEVMEEVGKKLGIKIEWVEETSWADYPQALANGRFDAFCVAGWPNSSRARVAQFTKPILYSPVNVYARANDTRFDKDINVLNDPSIKLVFIDGTTSQLITKESFPKASYDSLPALTQFSNLYVDVDAHKADAVVMDSATSNHFIKANPGKIKMVTAGKELRVFPNLFAVKKGEYDLQQALDTVLYELNGLGVIDTIIKKYEPLPGTYYRVSPGYQK
jgi:ABC-type amino acid transport substrate-binding protein